MSTYDPQSWQVPTREPTWDQAPHSGGLGNSSQQPSYQVDTVAFHWQFADVERAFDNLLKNGKLYPVPYRRDSIPIVGASSAYGDYGPRMSQRHSVDYDQMRPHSGSNVQGYYASQRQQPRPSETEQMMQAKRRMAAQRERDLRNYHQEQQYNRNVNVQAQSDGSMSPNAMNDDDRRELIARQHRALYGNEGPFYDQESQTPKPSQSASGHTSSAGGRGPSPREYGSFSMGPGLPQATDENNQLNPGDPNAQGQKRPSPKPQPGSSHENSTTSPVSNPTSQNFSIFESGAQQSSRTSTSSPGGSPPRPGKASSGVAPIGTRPVQANNPAIANRRSGTPSQSPLSHGFSANNDNLGVRAGGNDRAPSSASNPTSGAPKEQTTSAWGSNSGVWGNSGNNKSVGAVWG